MSSTLKQNGTVMLYPDYVLAIGYQTIRTGNGLATSYQNITVMLCANCILAIHKE